MKKFYWVRYTVRQIYHDHTTTLRNEEFFDSFIAKEQRIQDLDMLGADTINVTEISLPKHLIFRALAALVGCFSYRTEKGNRLFWMLLHTSGYGMEDKLACWFDEKSYQYRKNKGIAITY